MLFVMLCSSQLCAQSFIQNFGQRIKKEVKREINRGQKKTSNKNVVNTTDIPITKMDTWRLDVKDGKPHYNYVASTNEHYYLDSIKYEHPDGLKPFMYTKAIAIFKAKEGYYFDKSLKLNEYKEDAETTVGFKILDKHTVRVNLMTFTGAMGHDVKISPEMRAYKEKISTMNITPVASAQLYTPLYDYWYKKFQRRDFENNSVFVNRFINKNQRAYYIYPTTEESKCTDGTILKNARKEKIGPDMKILSVNILDDDLSDDIPGLVGEWCLISDNRFIPKACLKDIKYGNKYGDPPAKLINSPFEFAGGTGTLEDPYLIQTAEQLNAVRKGPKNHYKLIADIDLSKWGNWIPIGGTDSYGFHGGGWDKADKGAHAFQGSFDGNGHVISGMQIVINEETPFLTEKANLRAYGLFANLATNPKAYKIQNLGVVNFNIDVNYTNLKNEVNLYAGAICGGMNNGMDIYNCYSKGGKISIRVKGTEAYRIKEKYGRMSSNVPLIHVRAGGICAYAGGAFAGANSPRKHLEFVHIENCFNASDIEIEIENMKYAAYGAGIVGEMAETHIHNCYNSGNISLPLELEDLVENHKHIYTAGISGYASIRELPGIYHWGTELTSFIQNCYNTGQIVGRGAAGIFHDSLSDIHIENCYNSGVVIANEFDHSNDGIAINPIVGKACAIIKYGKEYVRNATTNGNAVTGSMWTASSTLGRKVLAAIPEDTHPSKKYEVAPVKVGAFTDVDAVAWYAKGVKWALDKNIISDKSTKFSPDAVCNKGDFYTFLWNASGCPEASDTNGFSDVNANDSYYKAAIWAKEKGFVTGNTFAPKKVLTRRECVISLWKFVGSPEGFQANQYLEIEKHQSDFGRAVGWSHMNSVIGGTAMHKFSPEKSCTKAEAISYIYRALK